MGVGTGKLLNSANIGSVRFRPLKTSGGISMYSSDYGTLGLVVLLMRQ